MKAFDSSNPVYSFIFPVKDEEKNIPTLFQQIQQLMNDLDGPSEVIFVDDGSVDSSLEKMRSCQEADSRVRIIQLSRNFGQQVAFTAGLDHAKGQAVVIMDSDLQDPLSVVPQMIAEWKNGVEIVYGIRTARKGEGMFKKASAAIFYRMLNRITEIQVPMDVGDFRLVDRKALDAFLSMRERNRYVRGMFAWIGFRSKGIPYVREERYSGKTKYSLRRMIKLALDAIVSFSDLPLQVAMIIGMLCTCLSVLFGIFLIISKYIGAYVVTGWTSLMVLITFLGGMIIMLLGFLGIYVGRIYDETKARPLYVIREIHPSGDGRESERDSK